MQPNSILFSILFPHFSRPKQSRFLSSFEHIKQTKEIEQLKDLFINVEDIQKGYDKRTSVLLRNLPTDITKEQLRTILLEIGNINFLFLPFDKQANKLVGIAFVNFVNYKNVLDAYTKLHGTKLDGFDMKRPLEVRYSKNQGKVELTKTLTQKKEDSLKFSAFQKNAGQIFLNVNRLYNKY